jgi:hypothetical protein
MFSGVGFIPSLAQGHIKPSPLAGEGWVGVSRVPKRDSARPHLVIA